MVSSSYYPRQLTGGRWQGASGKSYASRREAERDTAASAAAPGTKPKPRRRGLIIACAVGLALCLLLVKADFWRSTANSQLCGWSSVMIEAPPGVRAYGQPNRDDCDIVSGGISATFHLFVAKREGTVVNVEAVQKEYARLTGASPKPGADLSAAAAFSWPQLIWSNRLPMTVFETPGHRRGFVIAPISQRVVLAGAYVSVRSETAGSVRQALRLRLNPSGKSFGSSIWAKLDHSFILLIVVLPLSLLVFSRSIFRSFDKWWNLATALGVLLYLSAITLALAGFAWLLLRVSGWSTFSLGAMLLTVAGIAQAVYNLLRDRRLRMPLTPFDAEELRVFQTLKASSTTVEIGGAEIPAGHSLDVEMWVPRRAHCAGCGLNYAVYVPARASRSLSHAPRGEADIPLRLRQELYTEAFRDAPGLSNGCIRCGQPLDGAQAVTVPRKEPAPFRILIGIACVTLPAAILIALKGGPIAEAVEGVPGIGPWLGEILGDFTGLVLLLLVSPPLYLLWRLLAGMADLNAKQGKAPHRMSACPREGIVFEDINATRDMECPSCKGARETLRHFRIAAA